MIAAAIYAVAGTWIVPLVVHRQVEKRVAALLDREVSLGDVQFNPFTFALTLERFSVAGVDEDPVASVAVARINFDPWESLAQRQWRFARATLTAPRVRLVVEANGELNIADLFEQPAREREGGGSAPHRAEPPRFRVDQLRIEDGAVEFLNRSKPSEFTTTVHPITLGLDGFSTARDVTGAYRLTGSTGRGETFTLTGEMTAVPFGLRGEIALSAIALPAYQPFVAAFLNGEIRAGEMDVAARYEVGAGREQRVLVHEMKLTISKLALALTGAKQAQVEVETLEIEVSKADLLAPRVRVARLLVQGPGVRVVREADGVINLAQFIPSGTGSGAPLGSEEAADVPEGGRRTAVWVEQFLLENGTISLVDRAVSPELAVSAQDVRVVVSGVTPDPTVPAEVELAFRLLEQPGALKAAGTVTRQPLALDAQASASGWDLSLASRYLATAAGFEITSGRAEVDGRIEASAPDGQPLSVRWTGTAAVDDFATRDRAFDRELIAWKRLGAEGGEFTLSPPRFSAQEITLAQPRVNLVLREDGALNLTAAFDPATDPAGVSEPSAALVAGSAQDASERPEGEGAEARLEVTIRRVQIEGGEIAFTDRSVAPAATVGARDLKGTLSGLSTQPGGTGEVKVSATIIGSTPATLEGRANLLGPDLLSRAELTLDLRGVRLEPLEPYVMSFLGYRVARGKMRGDFEYTITQGMLDGKNRVVLDNFYLGEAVPSPNAISAPIKLALAVLRNRDGEVVLEVPVSGSLKSPDFDFGQTIRGAFGNILGQVATAPFAFLGSLLGGAGGDLDEVEFRPGEASISDDAGQKLEFIARALRERPGLGLVIRWQVSPAADRDALRERRLNEMIRHERDRLSQAAATESSDEEALRVLYARRIHADADQAGPGTAGKVADPAGVSSADAPNEDRPPWYARIWRVVRSPFFGGEPGSGAEEGNAIAAPPSEAVMRRAVLESIQLGEASMAELAESRARAARERFVNAGVDPKRIEIKRGAEKLGGEREEAARVTFELEPTKGAG